MTHHQRTHIAAAALAASALLAACGSSDGDAASETTDAAKAADSGDASVSNPGVDRERVAPVVDGELALPDGAYELSGYGTVLAVDGDEVTPLYATASTCAAGEPFDNDFPVDHADDDGGVITLDLVGPTTDYSLRPLVAAPECDSTPADALTALDEAFSTHYPFFQERGIDWSERFDAIAATVGNEADGLQEALVSFMVDLGDGHTTFDELELDIDRAAFDMPDLAPDADLGELIGAEFEATFERIVDPSTDASGTIAWGTVDGASDVGYLVLTAFEGLSGTDDAAADRAALTTGLDEAIADLDAAVDRLVVDLRFNPGGYEDLAVAAAGYFVDTPTDAYRKWAYAQPDPVAQTIEVTPQASHFDGTVAVLTSPATASAAEALVLSLREVADASIVGNRSFGEFSDAIDWMLPDGTEFTMSMEVYTDLDGENFEAVGVPTDVGSPFDRALDAAVAELTDR
jgi:Peptidase family S41